MTTTRELELQTSEFCLLASRLFGEVRGLSPRAMEEVAERALREIFADVQKGRNDPCVTLWKRYCMAHVFSVMNRYIQQEGK